jgi:osmotically-inducible protein OsmY
MSLFKVRQCAKVCGAVFAASAVLAGCDKTTTVTQTPAGTVTTTTIAPSAEASAVIAKVDASLAQAASAVQSSDAASQALTKVGDAIEDGAITAQIKAALLTDPDVKGLRIGVDTKVGVVRLLGSVPNRASLNRAERIARDTPGVKSVENRLIIPPPA